MEQEGATSSFVEKAEKVEIDVKISFVQTNKQTQKLVEKTKRI